MRETHAKHTAREGLMVLALLIAALLLGLGIIDDSHVWGDDFAGYILEGKAIAEGTVREQTELNAVLHPSPRVYGDVTAEGPLVYVWGMPMILSLVYALVGYDRPMGQAIICYKLPGAVFFAVFIAVLYLFYRRRFSYAVSLFLTALMCLHPQLIAEVNYVGTDIPCLAASTLSLLLIDVFLGERRPRGRVLAGIALGAALWFTCEVRLNGMTVVLAVLLAHVLWLLRERPRGRALAAHALPWLVFAALYGVTRIFLPAATSNTSHIARGATSWIFYNLSYYDGLIQKWVMAMLPEGLPLREYAHVALYAAVIAGILTQDIRSHLHLIVLLVGTYGVLYLLPYVQDLRYMFNILPVMLMFAAYGVRFAAGKIAAHISGAGIRRGCLAACCVIMALTAGSMLCRTLAWERQERAGRDRRYEAYSPEMTDMFAYVLDHVDEDDVIAFFKPRLLYLSTGRVGIVPGVNGNLFKHADYILLRKEPEEIRWTMWQELWDETTLEYENDGFELYSLSEAYKNAEW